MAAQSKVAESSWNTVLADLLIGSRKKKFISGAILVIIAFLIHIRNLQSSTDNIKIKPRTTDKKKVLLYTKLGWKR